MAFKKDTKSETKIEFWRQHFKFYQKIIEIYILNRLQEGCGLKKLIVWEQ